MEEAIICIEVLSLFILIQVKREERIFLNIEISSHN